MDVNEHNKQFYRTEYLSKINNDALTSKVYRAYHWLADNEKLEDTDRYAAAELAYYAIVEELAERGVSEPDYDKPLGNAALVESIFADILHGDGPDGETKKDIVSPLKVDAGQNNLL